MAVERQFRFLKGMSHDLESRPRPPLQLNSFNVGVSVRADLANRSKQIHEIYIAL